MPSSGYQRLSSIDKIRGLHARLERNMALLSALDLAMNPARTTDEVMELASYRWERISREVVSLVDRICTESADDRAAEAEE